MILQERIDLHGTSRCIYICLGLGLRKITSSMSQSPPFPSSAPTKYYAVPEKDFKVYGSCKDKVDNPTPPRASNDAFDVIGANAGVPKTVCS